LVTVISALLGFKFKRAEFCVKNKNGFVGKNLVLKAPLVANKRIKQPLFHYFSVTNKGIRAGLERHCATKGIQTTISIILTTQKTLTQ